MQQDCKYRDKMYREPFQNVTLAEIVIIWKRWLLQPQNYFHMGTDLKTDDDHRLIIIFHKSCRRLKNQINYTASQEKIRNKYMYTNHSTNFVQDSKTQLERKVQQNKIKDIKILHESIL